MRSYYRVLRGAKLSKVCRYSVLKYYKNTLHENDLWAHTHVRTYSQDPGSLAPLKGIRVLDLSRVLAGPYCSMLLGDLGAEIIKIERPGVGCDTRGWGPPFIGTESAYFLSVNRNKKSVCVDLKSPEGVKIIHSLAKSCDVLLENYVPGKLDSLGLGYTDIQTVAPHIVYCSITGYGHTGPYRKRAGYDVIAAGMGGLMHITGPRDGDPCKVGVAMTDLSTGLYALSSILVASLANIASNYLNAGKEASRYGTAHESIVPYQAFQTSDGYLIIGAGNNRHFKLLCQLMSLGELAEDERFSDNQNRVDNRDVLLSILGDRFQKKTTKEWMGILETSGIPYGPINNMEQVFSDPQVVHNGMIQEVDHPTAGKVRLPGHAVKYSESTTVSFSAPPTLGQHTDEVLSDILQYTPGQIHKLKEDGVI